MKKQKMICGKKGFERGLTAIELIIGLAVIALVIAGVAATARTMFRDQKVNGEVARVQLMQQKLRAYYSTSTTTASATAQLAIDAGAVSPDAISGGNIISKFGGGVNVAPATINTANDAIDIVYAAVPQVECINFVKAAGPSFDLVTVNGTQVKAPGANTAVVDATLNQACTGGGNNNQITFRMARQ